MNNLDMPIHGSFKQVGDVSVREGGLTKREHFAGTAPDQIPDWFDPSYPAFESPLNDQESKDAAEVYADNFSYMRFSAGEKACQKSNEALRKYCKSRDEHRYFAWRSYYADAIIETLSNQGGV